ncbi:MAG: bifunctional 3-(3-hydroxy-phenyl)propionate/3-hydroxycinnamic acid hydroxylase [Ilumatobacteraceae bacterium]
MKTAFDVVVVGMGPTGATLANLCGQRGLQTLIIERSAEPYPQPRACHLDAEIARVFQGLGFERELHELLSESAGMEYVDETGARLFTFEGVERAPLLGWHEDYVFIQPQIDAMLRDGLSRFANVEVQLGHEAPPIDELLEIGRFIVGCDGAGSVVRGQLGAELIDLGFDQRWLVVDVMMHDTASPALPSIIQQVCDPERLATFVPSHGRHRRWEFHLDDDEPTPDPWQLLAPWHVAPHNANLVRAVAYRFHALVADRWRVGNVFVAGDAAHQMPPFMGQGMCSGVRDVVNLAWKLAEMLDTATDSEAADRLLDSYEAERRPHVEAVTRLSIEAGDMLSRLAADPSHSSAALQPAEMPSTSVVPEEFQWSRLPGLDLGHDFPVGHLVPQPDRLDDRLPHGWVWVTQHDDFAAPDGRPVVVDPNATYGRRAVLVRPDRYIAAVA